MSKLNKYLQKGGDNTLYVNSKNDPRYKAYSDSLNLYNKTKLDVNKLKKANNYPEWMGIVDDLNQNKSVEKSFLNLSKLNKKEPIYKFKHNRVFDNNNNTGMAGSFSQPNQKVEVLKRTEFPEINSLQNKGVSLEDQNFPLDLEFEQSLDYGKYIGHDRVPGSEYKRNSNGTYGEYVDKYDRPAQIKMKGTVLRQKGGKVDAKDANGDTYSKYDNSTFISNKNGKKYEWNPNIKKFLLIGSKEQIENGNNEIKKYGINNLTKSNAYKKGNSERAFNNINPQGYGDLESNLKRLNDFKNNKGREKNLWYDSESSSTGKNIYYNTPKRDDAFSLYLGLPQKNKSFELSNYKPSISNEQVNYYKPTYISSEMKQDLLNKLLLYKGGDSYNNTDKNEKYITNERSDVFDKEVNRLEKAGIKFENPKIAELVMDNPLGDFTSSFGKDENGSYISIYDKWDLQPFKTGEGASVIDEAKSKAMLLYLKAKGIDVNNETEVSSLFGSGKPFEVYDKIYYDSKTNKIKQDGGNAVPEVILEKGEYYKNTKGEVQKVSNKAPTHDEKYVIEDGIVNLTTKGKGGVLLNGVQSVVSNTDSNRSVNDESFQLTDALITLSKDEVEQMSNKFNLKFKPKKMSGSKFLDESTKQKNVVLNRYKNINYRNTELAANSLKANKAFISSLPSIEELYDEVFAKQEADKQGTTDLEEVAQTGTYKGIMNRYPSMNGRIPVGRTKDNNKPITMLNNRTISMDDVFTSDSVEVKDGKAHTFYNSKLKKYIKK